MRKSEFSIEKAILKHGNKYDYSKVKYIDTKTKVIIICSEHGEFEQTPNCHISGGKGCIKCGFVSNALKRSKSVTKFISDANLKHDNKYDYSKVVYINAKTKVIIICPKHGEFEQTPDSHIRSYGCPKCGEESGSSKHLLGTDEFIRRCKEIHGNKYDYTKTIYKTGDDEVIITCYKHGEFTQIARNHFNSGCYECGLEKISTRFNSNTDKFIEKAIKMYGDIYDYSDSLYVKSNTNLKIKCNKCGNIFEKTPNKHLGGQGCPKCSEIEKRLKSRKTLEEFITEANSIHGGKYGYENVEYVTSKDKVLITCPIHGTFEQTPDGHLAGKNCSKCNYSVSKAETEIVDFLSSIYSGIIKNSDRVILGGRELDIYLPDINLAIEFNGLYWHNELSKDDNYHLIKTNDCLENGIMLIHVFEDEWSVKKDIVKSRLSNILGLTDNRIYARKCVIKDVNWLDTKDFLDKNHLQGKVTSMSSIGLYYNDELVSLMTFNKPRVGTSNDNIEFELTRFCNKLNTNVVGGASRLLKHFIKNNKCSNILSYADVRWSDGGLYETLGFDYISSSVPNYQYIINNERVNKSRFRKDKLIKEGFDGNKSEHEIMLERGIFRIYDCGVKRYVLNVK